MIKYLQVHSSNIYNHFVVFIMTLLSEIACKQFRYVVAAAYIIIYSLDKNMTAIVAEFDLFGDVNVYSRSLQDRPKYYSPSKMASP